jgi:NADH-quinone oxidoreductase subunit E
MEYPDIVKKNKDAPDGIIETYHEYIDRYGFLPQEVIIEAAANCGISVAEAYGVATFYSMFSVKPRGKNIIRVCQSAPCHMTGAALIAKALQQHLGIKMGETTPDQQFTLEYTECVGQCQATPVFTVNGEAYPGLAIEAIPEILRIYQSDPGRKEDY